MDCQSDKEYEANETSGEPMAALLAHLGES